MDHQNNLTYNAAILVSGALYVVDQTRLGTTDRAEASLLALEHYEKFQSSPESRTLASKFPNVMRKVADRMSNVRAYADVTIS